MKDEEKQAPSQQATPDNPLTQPNTFPTPAHPLPRYLSKRHAILALIFIFLIFVLVGINNFLAVKETTNTKLSQQGTQMTSPPTLDPTANSDSIGANWKTYKDKTYGFEVKYPPIFQTDENVGRPKDTITFLPVDNPVGNTHPRVIRLLVYKDALENVFRSVQKETANVKRYNKNDIRVIEYFRGVQNGDVIATAGRHILIDGKTYTVDLNDQNEGDVEDSRLSTLLDQILSTFKFLNEDKKLDITNWKQYPDLAGYTFMYPKTLIISPLSHLEENNVVLAESFGILISITINQNPNKLSKEQWLEKLKKEKAEKCEIECDNYSEKAVIITINSRPALFQHVQSVINRDYIFLPLTSDLMLEGYAENTSEKPLSPTPRQYLTTILDTISRNNFSTSLEE